MTIASEISRLQNAKTNIKQAIIDKGVSVGSELMIDEYACCIGSIQQGASIPLDDPIITGSAGNGKNLLYINDPSDDTYKGIDVTCWACSKIIRKQGSAPSDENDGVLVTTINTRDQYESTPFEDTGLTNGADYYYKVYSKASLGLGSESGSLCLTPTAQFVFDFMLIGGGGGGGHGYCSACTSGGGGGGAGGVILCNGYVLVPDTTDICVNIGGRGSPMSNGGNSCFNNFVAYGGGGGGSAGSGYEHGCSGGSGGGGISRANGGSGTSGQGKNGAGGSNSGGGGGGGYCGAGNGWSSGSTKGYGGLGLTTDISGTNASYAGGGGGGYCCFGANGCSGGGNGGCRSQNGCNATTCGSGGGGGGPLAPGGCGAGGLFIIRYPTSCGYDIEGGCKYTCGNYTIHCFTSDGALIIN